MMLINTAMNSLIIWKKKPRTTAVAKQLASIVEGSSNLRIGWRNGNVCSPQLSSVAETIQCKWSRINLSTAI